MDFEFNGVNLAIADTSTSEALFLASDVAKCLGLHVKTISRFLKDNLRPKDYRTVPSGQGRPSYYVNESGLYDIILLSKTETARDFRYWITDEVLPTIRKHGAYISPDITKDQAIAAKQQLDRILDTPDPWERMYTKEACSRAFKWFGAGFYWTYCYSWMTAEERCKVDRINPVINGERKHKIHRCIDPETRDRLTPKVTRLVDFLISSTSKQDFETRMGRIFGCDQAELPFCEYV